MHAVVSTMSARSTLDACIRDLEDNLGIAPQVNKQPSAQVPRAVPSAAQLLDDAIADLESSLGLRSAHRRGEESRDNEQKHRLDGPSADKNKTRGAKTVIKKDNSKGVSAGPSTAGDQPAGTKIDLRVGLITKAWIHETADKLYCEEIDVGEESPRLIASGLVPHYSLEEMQGRTVVVMCNLKPRNLKGFKSHGMVVCAAAAAELGDGKEKVEFIVPPEGVDIGEQLYFDGVEGGPFEPVSAAQMEKKKVLDNVLPELTTDAEGTVKWRDHVLVSSKGPCCAPTVRNGNVR